MPCVCSVIYHRGSQTVVGTSVTHLAAPCVTSLFLPHFDIISYLLLDRHMATCILFVEFMGTWWQGFFRHGAVLCLTAYL